MHTYLFEFYAGDTKFLHPAAHVRWYLSLQELSYEDLSPPNEQRLVNMLQLGFSPNIENASQ